MQRLLILLLTVISVILLIPAHQAIAASGSVELDEFSFDKVINKFQAALVKFDVAFPYGEKHDAFVAVAKDSKDVDDLLIAEVGVKDYGEKDNEPLAKKYGATKDNFPVIKLFIKGQVEPIAFDDSQGVTSDNLRRFVRENTGIYLSLPGCLRELDMIAIKFMKSVGNEQNKILTQAQEIVKNLKDKEYSSGKIYKTIMEKIIEKGHDFVETEYERVKKLLGGKISDEKKKELGIRTNILQTFLLNGKKTKVVKEDL